MKPLPRRSRATRPAPETDHAVLSEAQQARHLGVRDEVTMNLGHRVRQDYLTESPVGPPLDYENGAAARVINERRSQGVYQRFSDPRSGIASANNLKAWSGYSTANSYGGKDPKGRGEGSDGHLASTKNWPSFDYGSESGLGRLEKSGKR